LGDASLTTHGDRWAAACSDEEARALYLDRPTVIPVLGDDYTIGPELEMVMFKALPKDDTGADTAPPPLETSSTASATAWHTFSISASALSSIKALAVSSLPPDGPAPFISTDDALTAFIWQCMARARQPRLGGEQKSTLARSIDVRRVLGIPETYPGFVQNETFLFHTLGGLATMPLGALAAELRAALLPRQDRSDLAFRTRAMVTAMSRAADKRPFSFAAVVDYEADCLVSSWSKAPCYGNTFGMGLGTPEALRRPAMEAVESLCFYLPKRLDGGVEISWCLREEDFGRLMEDERWREWTRYCEVKG
jgi:hypothetical protein